MTAFWKGMWLALWLLSQWLGFGFPGLSHAAEQSAPTWPACGQTQPANDVYDAGFLSGLDYGVELPSSTTEGFNEVVAESKATSVYDPNLVSFSQITGSTRAVPAGEVGFPAAKETATVGDFMAQAEARLNAVKAEFGNMEAYNMVTPKPVNINKLSPPPTSMGSTHSVVHFGVDWQPSLR